MLCFSNVWLKLMCNLTSSLLLILLLLLLLPHALPFVFLFVTKHVNHARSYLNKLTSSYVHVTWTGSGSYPRPCKYAAFVCNNKGYSQSNTWFLDLMLIFKKYTIYTPFVMVLQIALQSTCDKDMTQKQDM